MSASLSHRAFRGEMVHFIGDPAELGDRAIQHFTDGLLFVRDGQVAAIGPYQACVSELPPDTPMSDYRGKLIMPGFVDMHTHYSQTDMIASHGETLLDWLNKYTYPAEQKFDDPGHAEEVAQFFVEELLANGITTAMVFATVHKVSVDAIFGAAESRRMCLLAGKVMMDRNAPDALLDTAESSYADACELIRRWHRVNRLRYAITPRFAPTSTERQLGVVGALANEYPNMHIQSHLAENRSELAWVSELYPWSPSYLDIYDRYGLVRPGAVYAHCIHLDGRDRSRIAQQGAAMAFCPTSNLFLGSGLFDVDAAQAAGARIGIGTDVGAGTSFSMLRTLHEAYKVCRLAGQRLSPEDAFYFATLGGARALCLDDEIGNLQAGKVADFIVLDCAATPLMARRMQSATSLAEKLFILMMLGDDRSIAATYVFGRQVH